MPAHARITGVWYLTLTITWKEPAIEDRAGAHEYDSGRTRTGRPCESDPPADPVHVSDVYLQLPGPQQRRICPADDAGRSAPEQRHLRHRDGCLLRRLLSVRGAEQSDHGARGGA